MQFTDVSDPRLAGTWRVVLNSDTIVAGPSVWSATSRIDDEAGSRLGTMTGYRGPDDIGYGGHSAPWHHQGVLTGSGAYEGLTVVVFLGSSPSDVAVYDVHGVVLPGTMPDMPEYPESPE